MKQTKQFLFGAEALLKRLRAERIEHEITYEATVCPTCCGAGMGCLDCADGLIEVMLITYYDERDPTQAAAMGRQS